MGPMNEIVEKTGRPGRPREEAAASHEKIMDAVHQLLQERPARDVTMEAVAKRAGVGKPTLYKWWPTKAALVFALFHERLATAPLIDHTIPAEQALRARMHRLVDAFNGLFGKVMADLVAEGQSDPRVLRDLHDQHIKERRAAAINDVERGVASGEFRKGIDAETAVDAIVGAIYTRLLLRPEPLTSDYADRLIDQVLK